MKKPDWFERKFEFGISAGMLPFFVERLEGTIARLEKKVQGQPDRILSYQPQGKWSIKQHIGHLAEVDEIALRRIDEMINGISPMKPAVFEPRQDYNHQPVDKVLEYFTKNRIRNLKKYKSLPEADCTKVSLHPRLKMMMNPVDLAFFDAEHDDHHLVKIREIQEVFRH
ncbi:MAG: DinB family protein [Cyclobacteriaceae bacterium]